MTTILLTSLLFLSTAHADVQSAQCFPNTSAAKDWPISAIYLHGLFTVPGGKDAGFRGLEATNRATLEQLATELKIKIAVPLAPADGETKMRKWNSVSLPEIEAKASAACGGKEFAKRKAIIGFSNGAIWAAKNLNCGNTAAYTKVFVIGAQGTGGPQQGKCAGRFTESSPHVFPGINLREKFIDAGISGSEGSSAPAGGSQGSQVR